MIPKPGKPPSLSNLRPISLTSCVGKTLERMALTRLSDFIEAKEFFPPSLIGFRRHVCAQDMFLVLQHTFLSPSRSQIHALVTVDVRKAFDGVSHDHILAQLSSLSCGSRMYSYIRSFLSNRVARLRVDTHLSNPHSLTHGTPQGAVLSPTVFSMAMAPLPPNCPKYLTSTIFFMQTTSLSGVRLDVPATCRILCNVAWTLSLPFSLLLACPLHRRNVNYFC